MIKVNGVCPLCGGEGYLMSTLMSGECLYMCSECCFTPAGYLKNSQLAAEAWNQCAAPSIDGAKLNIVGWSWIAPDASGYVVTGQIEAARAAISEGLRVIPVYAAERETSSE